MVNKERREGASNRKTWIDEEEGDVVCVWWDWKEIVHYELLSCNKFRILLWTTAEITTTNWEEAELINRRGVVFHHDNVRPHTSLMTRQKLRELGWEVLMHPPYSPDIAPSDYHLFRSLQNSLNDVKLASKEACENHLKQFSEITEVLSGWNYGSAPKIAKYYRK